MILFSHVTRRSRLSGLTLAVGLLLLSMLLSACNSSTPTVNGPTPTPVANPAATACSVSVTDLGPGGSNKGTAPNDKATGNLAIDGSGELQPLVQRAVTEYQAANSGAKITLTSGDSSKGLADVESGAVQIGTSDLFAQTVNATTYTNLVDHQVGVVTFSLVVNPDVAAKITNLTDQQIIAIFTGQITNWKDLGGPDEAIVAFDRPSGADTETMFKKYVLGGATASPAQTLDDSDTEVGNAVSSTAGAIGYLATSEVGTGGAFKGKVTPVCIDGFKPGPTDVASNQYTFWSIEHLYTKGAPTGLAKTFLAYLTSDTFQTNDLPSLYFLPISKLSASAMAAHQP